MHLEAGRAVYFRECIDREFVEDRCHDDYRNTYHVFSLTCIQYSGKSTFHYISILLANIVNSHFVVIAYIVPYDGAACCS